MTLMAMARARCPSRLTATTLETNFDVADELPPDWRERRETADKPSRGLAPSWVRARTKAGLRACPGCNGNVCNPSSGRRMPGNFAARRWGQKWS